MTRIIALANQKGGVGKTTTALNLGATLAARTRRVLLIDLDPQSNLTIGLGVNPYEQTATSYQVLLNPTHGAGFAVQALKHGLHLIPSTRDMAAAELELAGKVGRELLLHEALTTVQHNYDYVLIDSPPSLGLFTLNALGAATEVLIPLQVEFYALHGTAQLQDVIRMMQKINPALRLGGILCTMVDRRTSLSQEIEENVRQRFGDLVYRTTIPKNVRLAEAPASGQPITIYDPNSLGARAYTALAEEILHAQA